jgi:NADH pyrophosphatase NudC (nudix superfamily)
MFFYEVELLSEEFRPAPDEIEEVRWFPLEEAVKLLRGVKRKKLEELL